MPAPRYLPDLVFPPYTFIPGRDPHPRSDPRGHSFGIPPEPADPLDPSNWQSNRTYLGGIDLFNHGYYWEAHEVWESLWNACGRSGPDADFLKALIKLAAAGVKAGAGTPAGVRGHARRAAELIAQVRSALAAPRHLGLDLDELLRRATAVADNAAETPIGLDLTLLPQ